MAIERHGQNKRKTSDADPSIGALLDVPSCTCDVNCWPYLCGDFSPKKNYGDNLIAPCVFNLKNILILRFRRILSGTDFLVQKRPVAGGRVKRQTRLPLPLPCHVVASNYFLH